MKGNRKGSNVKRTPSQNRITGESSTNQRYAKESLVESFLKQFNLAEKQFYNGAIFSLQNILKDEK